MKASTCGFICLFLLFAGWAAVGVPGAAAAPPTPAELLYAGVTASPGGGNIFGIRMFDEYVYVSSIGAGAAQGRTDPGQFALAYTTQAVATGDVRAVNAFPGAESGTYILVGGGHLNNQFHRHDFDLTGKVSATLPFGETGSDGWDWVGLGTVIFPGYISGRNNLYLMDVDADPFDVRINETWNQDGYVTTSAARIRNVRVGNTFATHAYYGESNNNVDPGVYALNLATGAETQLLQLGGLTGTGTFGVMNVVEAGGYLFVHTTDQGIYAYEMEDATTIGTSLSGDPLVPYYSAALLNEVTGQGVFKSYAFDVAPDLSRILVGYTSQGAYHLIPEPSILSVFALGGLLLMHGKRRGRGVPRG